MTLFHRIHLFVLATVMAVECVSIASLACAVRMSPMACAALWFGALVCAAAAAATLIAATRPSP